MTTFDMDGNEIKNETCCPECGFDMGSGYTNCGMSEDGTCPECHTVKPEQNKEHQQ